MTTTGRRAVPGGPRIVQVAPPGRPISQGSSRRRRRTVGRAGVARGARLAPVRRGISMFDRRRWARHGRAGRLALRRGLPASAWSATTRPTRPGPPPSPPTTRPPTPAGRSGRRWRTPCSSTVGRASYLVLFASAVVDLLAFRRRKVADPALRLVGLALVVLVASALIQKFDPGRRPAPPVGSGGYVGAAAAAFLEGQFGPAGMLLILGGRRARRPGALPRRPDRLADPGGRRRCSAPRRAGAPAAAVPARRADRR